MQLSELGRWRHLTYAKAHCLVTNLLSWHPIGTDRAGAANVDHPSRIGRRRVSDSYDRTEEATFQFPGKMEIN